MNFTYICKAIDLKSITLMAKRWIRNIIGGLSLTSALFIFQACYGTMQDYGHDVHVYGKITSKKTGLPIEGIKISIEDDIQYEYTNDEGRFHMYIARQDTVKFLIKDIAEKKTYIDRDTIVINPDHSISLDIKLEEQ